MWGGANLCDVATVAYDAATGHELWATRIESAANAYYDPIALGGDGRYVFVGGTHLEQVEDNDYIVVALDAASGAEVWEARYDYAGAEDNAYAMTASPDGSLVYITGGSQTGLPGIFFPDAEWATVAYDAATGIQRWASRWHDPLAPESRWGNALGITRSPDGERLYVTGQAGGSYTSSASVVAYDALLGTELWASSTQGTATEQGIGSAVAVSPDNQQILLTGLTAVSGPSDALTVAYDAGTGSQLWAARYPADGTTTTQTCCNRNLRVAFSPGGERAYTLGWIRKSDFYTGVLAYDLDVAPVANAGADFAIDEGDTAMLSGALSSDANGDTLTYSWTQTAGPAVTLSNGNTATPSFVGPEVAADTAFTFELTVADPGGLSDTDSITITVRDLSGNLSPVANAGPDQIMTEGEVVHLNGAASADPDGETLTYSWAQAAGPAVTLSSANTATPSFTAPSVGSATPLTFRLTVSDPQAASATDDVVVTVQDIDGGGAPSTPDTGAIGNNNVGGAFPLVSVLLFGLSALLPRRRGSGGAWSSFQAVPYFRFRGDDDGLRSAELDVNGQGNRKAMRRAARSTSGCSALPPFHLAESNHESASQVSLPAHR